MGSPGRVLAVVAAVLAALMLVAVGTWFLVQSDDDNDEAQPSRQSETPARDKSPRQPRPEAPAAARTCEAGANAVLAAAIKDIVAKGDVGPAYARASRKYGDESEPWRLASTLFPPVYASLDANGAAAARDTGAALVTDACERLHDPRVSQGQRPDLSGASAIELDDEEPEATPTSPPTAAAPVRSCYTLEEPPRMYAGNYLTLGNRGLYIQDVLELQSRLNWLGYGCTPEDGYFGPETASIVRQFQSDYGLVVDGEVGPQTWNALFGVYD